MCQIYLFSQAESEESAKLFEIHRRGKKIIGYKVYMKIFLFIAFKEPFNLANFVIAQTSTHADNVLYIFLFLLRERSFYHWLV